MAEKSQQSPIPLAPAINGYRWSDTEAAAMPDGGATEQQRSNKRIKCILYIFLFAVFQTGIILLFTFTVMKIRTPKFRVNSATLDNSNVAAVPTNSSLTLAMNAELDVKNSNFGRFKFERTSVFFYYNGAQVAEAPVVKGRANWRSTKKLNVAVNVSVGNSAELQRDLSVGVVSLSSRAQMRGNVRLVMVFKKNRSVDLNCTMEIVIGTQKLRNIVCD